MIKSFAYRTWAITLVLCADRAIFSDGDHGDNEQVSPSRAFHTTATNKPLLEYKYMGWATERIFLPLLRTSVPNPLGYNPIQISQIYWKALAHLLPRHTSQEQPPLRARSQFA